MKTFVGLDISLQKTAICVEYDDASIAWQGKIGSSPAELASALAPWKDTIALVGLEACPLSESLTLLTMTERGAGGHGCRVIRPAS